MTNLEGYYVEYRPTARERFWRKMGYRFHLGEQEPGGPTEGKCWSGWMQTRRGARK